MVKTIESRGHLANRRPNYSNIADIDKSLVWMRLFTNTYFEKFLTCTNAKRRGDVHFYNVHSLDLMSSWKCILYVLYIVSLPMHFTFTVQSNEDVIIILYNP